MSTTVKSLLSIVVAAVMLTGCSSTPGAGTKTSENIMAAAKALEDGRTQLDRVSTSLNTMVSNPNTNLRPAFKDYSSNLDRLESAARDVQRRAERMKSAGQSYFKDWDAEIATINNEDIRNRSAERRAAVEQSFARISGHYQELGAAYKPLMSDFQDIRTALNTDLTASGVESIRPIADRTVGEAATVKDAASKLAAEFRSLGVQLSASGR